MMKTQCISSDRISSLPQNIIETILTLMPIRDALRTSILSKKWSGPTILKFELDFYKLGMITEFDQIILGLSRRSNVKDLIIDTSNSFYKLTTSFFLMQGLESISLKNCNFEPPVNFNGFSKLRNMCFENVRVHAEVLQNFLPNCPLLEDIRLLDYEEEYVEENSFNFVKFFQCVPLLHTLAISENYMKFLSSGGMPSKLSTSLHLTYVCLDVCLREQDVISSVLCIIRSSPNLERIFFQMYDNEKLPIQESSIKFDDLQDDLSLTLDHLKSIDIVSFSNIACEMVFVKLIMGKSPILKIARVELSDNVSFDEELKILREMIRVQIPRASPSAQLIIERPKKKL
ncbi:F-box/FBD/LRR-repeat protein At1g13570-like isoform X2 [Rutidosis leptorrhynchoides]|uniref:F-box/FBD/LRR-repeat protein At1g13570-like isoform X2 n=1 Tax=Rutidosis leptorrhynchoides TaxID=125765 RepID=UPI003A99DA06